MKKTFFLACMIIMIGKHIAEAQMPDNLKISVKHGWLHANLGKREVNLDTVENAAAQHFLSDYISLDGYRVAIPASGEVFVFQPQQSVAYLREGYTDHGTRRAEPMDYGNKMLLFIAFNGNYFIARPAHLVELNLITGSYHILAEGKQITSAKYSSDQQEISFTLDGVEKKWHR